jgi:hypothetical protein
LKDVIIRSDENPKLIDYDFQKWTLEQARSFKVKFEEVLGMSVHVVDGDAKFYQPKVATTYLSPATITSRLDPTVTERVAGKLFGTWMGPLYGHFGHQILDANAKKIAEYTKSGKSAKVFFQIPERFKVSAGFEGPKERLPKVKRVKCKDCGKYYPKNLNHVCGEKPVPLDWSTIEPCKVCFHKHRPGQCVVKESNCFYYKKHGACAYCKKYQEPKTIKKGDSFDSKAEKQSKEKSKVNQMSIPKARLEGVDTISKSWSEIAKGKLEGQALISPLSGSELDALAKSTFFTMFTADRTHAGGLTLLNRAGDVCLSGNTHCIKNAKYFIMEFEGDLLQYPLPPIDQWTVDAASLCSDHAYISTNLYQKWLKKDNPSVRLPLGLKALKACHLSDIGVGRFVTFDPTNGFKLSSSAGSIAWGDGGCIKHHWTTAAASCGSIILHPTKMELIGFHYKTGDGISYNEAIPFIKK